MAMLCWADRSNHAVLIAMVNIATEPIDSIPRPARLLEDLSSWTCSFRGLSNSSTTRENAFAKIGAHLAGTALAGKMLGGG